MATTSATSSLDSADSPACASHVPAKACARKLCHAISARQAAVNQLIREAFLRGISTRQVSDVLQPVLGETYSPMTISNITRQLDTAVQQFHRGPLADEYLYLFLDGIVLKVRDSTRKVLRRMILVATG